MRDSLTGRAGRTGPGGAATMLVIATGHHLSLALLDGAESLTRYHAPLSRGHAEALMPALKGLLAGQPRPGLIVAETGPGSFTGLRVGIAAARALGIAWRVPVLGVASTLLVAAAATARGHRGPLRVALAAPRGQVWLQPFDGLEAVAPARSVPADRAGRVLAEPGPPLTGSAIEGAPEGAPDAAAARAVPRRLLTGPEPIYVSAPVREAA